MLQVETNQKNLERLNDNRTSSQISKNKTQQISTHA